MLMPMLALALLALAQLVEVAVCTGRPRDRHEEAGRDAEHLQTGAQRQVHDVDLGLVLRDRLENSLGNLRWRDFARKWAGLQACFRPRAGRRASETGRPTAPASRASRSGSPALDRSATTARESASSSASLVSAAWFRAESTNRAPARRRRRAMTGPIPVEAPVRRTVFPLRSFIRRRLEPP